MPISTTDIQNIKDIYNADTKNVANNTDAQNQLLANGDPQGFNSLADKAGFSKQVITPESLQPTTPFKLNPIPPATAADGLGAYIGSTTNASMTDIAQSQDQRQAQDKLMMEQKAKDSAKYDYLNKLLGQSGQKELTDKAYTATVDPLEKDLKDINQQILAEQVANRHQIEKLQKENPNGLYGGALQDEINRINQASVSKQADLSIIQMARQGRYDSAKQIADRKVAVQLEQNQQELQALKLNYEDNKDQFTKDEQRQYEAAIKKSDQAYEEKKTALKTLSDTKLDLLKAANEQNAPTAVLAAINAAQTPEEAINVAGKFGGDMIGQAIKKAQLANINSEIAKRNRESSTTIPTVTNPEASKYTGALNVILGSDKFTKDQKTSLVNSINSGEDAISVIKNQAKNIMGQTEATTVTKYETAKSSLLDIQKNLADFYARGGKTNIFSGSYEKVINKLGDVNDPNLVDLATQIQANLQVYRNAVSGTAYSEQEGKDINSIFPGINKTEGLNQAIINGRLKAFDSTIDGTYKSVLGKSYDAVKQAEVTAKSSAATPTVPTGMTAMVGPDGKQYSVPNDKVDAFIKDGGKKL